MSVEGLGSLSTASLRLTGKAAVACAAPLLEKAIVAELVAVAPTYPLVQPLSSRGRCIVYQLVSDMPLHMGGYVEPRMQLACWADSYADAVALEHDVWSLFEGRHVTAEDLHYRSMVISRSDGSPNLDVGRYCRIVDVRFFYRY